MNLKEHVALINSVVEQGNVDIVDAIEDMEGLDQMFPGCLLGSEIRDVYDSLEQCPAGERDNERAKGAVAIDKEMARLDCIQNHYESGSNKISAFGEIWVLRIVQHLQKQVW